MGPPLRALRGVVGNRALARAELAFLLFNTAEAATWVAILVYAFGRGGASATGLVGLVLLLPGGLVAPVAASLGDRFRRERLLLLGYVTQAITILATAVAMFVDLPMVVYGIGTIAMASFTVSRPAHHSLLPRLATTPEELMAANSLSSLAEGLGVTIGAAAVAVLLAFSGPGLVYAVMAGALAIGAVLALGISAEGYIAPEGRLRPLALIADVFEGLRVVVRTPGSRLLVGLAGVVTLVWGIYDILIVSLAIDRLGTGESGTGALYTAMGIGGLLGAAGTVALAGRRRLAVPLVVLSIAFGAGVAATAVPEAVAGALIVVAATGAGVTALDVVGRTLLQRVTPDAVLTRVFGAVEALWMIGVGVGSALAAVLVHAIGLEASFVATGAALPLLALVSMAGLRRMDLSAAVPERQLALLRRIPMFLPLAPSDLERVGGQLDLIEVRSGDVVIRQGDVGDRFYVIDRGSFEVDADGHVVNELSEGDHFGEIALLHDVPRTATVRATSDGAVWALDREEFLATVTGMPQAAAAAEAISAERSRGLGGPEPEPPLSS
jgi:MFS family permease